MCIINNTYSINKNNIINNLNHKRIMTIKRICNTCNVITITLIMITPVLLMAVISIILKTIVFVFQKALDLSIGIINSIIELADELVEILNVK